eukprot:scaffold1620_cov148-Amphora_coffeaeformis.AAC.2
MKLSTATILAASVGVTSAFAPSAKVSSAKNLAMSDEAASSEMAAAVESPPTSSTKAVFGWVPDASKPCYGLPGAVDPLGFFDPLEISKQGDLNYVKRLREAEVMHGRVAMMATVGYLIGENTPTIMYGTDIPTIANNQLAEVPGWLMLPFFLAINFTEAWRTVNGWVEPSQGNLFKLREGYYPGGIGFDPLGFRPTDPKEFETVATKELNNGRLAMLAVAGMCGQELATGAPLFH